MSASPFRRFNARVLVLCALLILLVGGFNAIVDPYGVWRLIAIEGVNQKKPVRRDHDMLFKAVDMMRKKPTTVFLGSSRVAYALDPDHPALDGDGPAYNLAILGGHSYIVRRYFEHAVYNDPALKTAILGADFFAFGSNVKLPAAFDDSRLLRRHMAFEDVVDTLFSLDALFDGVATIRSNLARPNYEPFYPNGRLTAIDMRDQVERKGMIDRFEKSLNLYLNGPSRLRTFAFSEASFANLERMIALSRERGIRLVVYVPPVHAALLEAMRVRDRWRDYRTWLRRLAKLTPYWDFSGYNTITTEKIERRMSWYWDISHCRKAVGDMILDRIYGSGTDGIPSDFGVYVTAETVARHIAGIEQARAEWIGENHDVVSWIRERVRNRPSTPGMKAEVSR
jgi:hypothetical protein